MEDEIKEKETSGLAPIGQYPHLNAQINEQYSKEIEEIETQSNTRNSITNLKTNTDGITEYKDSFKCKKWILSILGILVVIFIPIFLCYKTLSKKLSIDAPEAAPPGNAPFELSSIFNFKYDSNKKNTIIFSDNFIEFFNIDSPYLNYSQNSSCDFSLLNYTLKDVNYGYAYIQNIILNDDLRDKTKEKFNISSDYKKIPIVHFINDKYGNIKIISYNKNMNIKYLNIINNFLSNISNSIENKTEEDLELYNPIKSKEFELDNYERVGMIKDYQINYDSKIDKTLENNDKNENRKIYDIIKLIDFVPITSYNDINMEIKENHKNVSLNDEQLRQLEINLDQSIFFNYSIFEIKINSILKVSLNANLGVNYSNPNDTHIVIKLFMNVNDHEKIIINKLYKIPQFYNISSKINNVFNLISNDIFTALDYIENNLTNFKNEIYSNLTFINKLISNFHVLQHNISLQDLILNINNYIINGFNNSKIYAIETFNFWVEYINNIKSNIIEISLFKLNYSILIIDYIIELENILNDFQINVTFNQNNINSNAELDYENVKLYISLLENINNIYLTNGTKINNIINNLTQLIKIHKYNTTNYIKNSRNVFINDIQTNQIIFDNIDSKEIIQYIKILNYFIPLSQYFYDDLSIIINRNIDHQMEIIYLEDNKTINYQSLPFITNITENLIQMVQINLTYFNTYIKNFNSLHYIEKDLYLIRDYLFKNCFIENFKIKNEELIIDTFYNFSFIITSTSISDESFDNIINKLIDDIIDSNNLTTYLEKYYYDLKQATMENFYIFLHNRKEYIYNNNELELKIKIILMCFQKEIDILFYKIYKAYTNSINSTFSKSYFIIIEQLKKQNLLDIRQEKKYRLYLNDIQKKADDKFNSFNLRPDIETFEHENILKIIELVSKIKFEKNIMINLNGIQFFNNYIGIIIEYINTFQNIIIINIDYLINNNIFDELYSNSYSNDYFLLNYSDIISKKIISQFNEFNNNSKLILEKEFNRTINVTDIISNYNNISNDIFVFPFNLFLEIDNLLSASITQIKKLFGNQISYYLNINKNISNLFNQTNFENSFNGFKSEINDSYIIYIYKNNYQNYSFNLLDDLINYQKKIIEEKCDLFINNINKTCLIISTTFCEPNILFIKDLCDNINNKISIDITSISKNYFKSLINTILYKLNESNEILLNTIDNEKNNFISIINSNGNKDYNISNFDDIKNIFINFYSNFSNNISNTFINQYLEKNKNNLLNRFILLHNSSDEFFLSFVKSVISLVKNDSYSIIEFYFNKSIDYFNDYVGFYFFDEFITELLINNISSKINYIHNILQENYINWIIENYLIRNEIYNITKNLNNSLYSFYSTIKSLIKNNIESKIEIVIIPKLNEKINEISELIIYQFVDDLLNIWESDEFKSNFSEEYYNLISINKKFLINKLNQSYLELMNNKIVNKIISKINYTILSNLTPLYETLDNINNQLISNLKQFTIYNVEGSVQNLLNSLNDLNNSINEKENNISSIIENDINSFHEIFYNEFTNNFSKINEIYQNEKNKANSELQKELQYFGISNISSIISSTNNSYFNIMNILEKNIIQKTNDSLSNFDELDVINLNLRRATEYNNKIIDNQIRNYISIYKNFGSDILNNETYNSLSTIYNNFSDVIIEDIHNYSKLLKTIYQFECYKDFEQITYLYDLFGNETIIFTKTIENIKNEINNMYKNVEEILTKKIDQAFDSIPKILKLLTEQNRTQSSKTIENFINYSDNDIINNMITTLIIQNITYKNGYSIYYDKNNNNLCINLKVNANAFLDVNNTIDFITQRINGELGNAIIGLNINYSIYNDSTNVEAYFNQKKSNYSSSIIINNNFFNLTKNNYNLLYYTPELYNMIKRTINEILS